MARKKKYLILSINPGSTSTKIGVFRNEEIIFEYTVRHSVKLLEEYSKIWDQYNFRKDEIIEALSENEIDITKLNAVVGRGGLIKPIPSGVYHIDENMIEDARNGNYGHHASNLGCVIAYSIGWEFSIPTFIVDPPAVDDLEALAKVSGYNGIERRSVFHALNIFATSRKFATHQKRKFEDLNLIVAHLGGGITVAALRNGKAINVNSGLDEGPFSPERSGKLPLMQFMDMCLSGEYTEDELKKKIVGKGGLTSYFNTNKANEVENMVKAGSENFRLVYEAMAYQIAEEIASRASNLKGQVDAIILTGGIAHSDILCEWIKERVDFIAVVHRYPGESELEALAYGGLRVLSGEENAKHYTVSTKKIGIYYWDNLDVYISSVNTIEERLREKGYTFRQENADIEIQYVNCKSDEIRAQNNIKKFIDSGTDVVFTIGSPASVRAGQYLKGKNIPVICTGIYSSKVLANLNDPNFYASCYATGINEQMKNTVLKIDKNIKKLGFMYKLGELQSDIQHDELKEFCLHSKIALESFDIESQDDFPEAVRFFKSKKIDWLYLGADTIVANANNQQLEVFTSEFPTICTIENTIRNGGLISYHNSWKNVARDATDLAIDLFNDVEVKKHIIKPTKLEILVNRKTAKSLGLTDKVLSLKDAVFI